MASRALFPLGVPHVRMYNEHQVSVIYVSINRPKLPLVFIVTYSRIIADDVHK